MESRFAEFTELVATAIANAQSRAELSASRARIVAASDEARRRIERDLHDGAQQRLVPPVLELRAAVVPGPSEIERAQGRRFPCGEGDRAAVLDDPREMSRGIDPAILAEGGLGPALKTLARRVPIPVEVHVRAETRLPEPIEAPAYDVASVSFTIVVKIRAGPWSCTSAWRSKMARSTLRICDDGVGGSGPQESVGS